MAVRQIVHIDEDKCNGCGECIPSCAEGALGIVDGKARLVSDRYCDGLGECLGHCPRGAITLAEREAEEFDEQAVAGSHDEVPIHGDEAGRMAPPACSCPGLAFAGAPFAEKGSRDPSPGPSRSSELRQWPVQLALVPANAPYLRGADLLLAADCVPFALGDFHDAFLRGRTLVIGCPKLDDSSAYVDKLALILKNNNIRSLTVVHMEVPCCGALMAIARRALARSGTQVPMEKVTVGVAGQVAGPVAAKGAGG